MKYYTLASAAVLVAALTTPTFASTDVDFATTHLFQEQQVDKQYVLDALVQNSTARWNYDSPVGTPVIIYYAFTGEEFGYATTDDVRRDWYAYEKNTVVEELEEVSTYTGVTFVEVTDVASVNILFRISSGDGNGASMPPRNADEDIGYRTVALSENKNLRYLNPNREFEYVRYHQSDVDYKHDYSRSKWAIIHEIGHAIGLWHPFSAGENTVPAPLNAEDDHKFNTVMAYNWPEITSESYEATSFKYYDVIALQHLYGKNVNKETGDTLYEYDDTYDFHQTIIDVDGNDTISVANSERNNVIDLRGAQFSSIAPNYVGWYVACEEGGYECGTTHEHLGRSYNSLAIDVDTVIENATGGSGDDTLVANSTANMLDGGEGVDTAMFAGDKADYNVEFTSNAVTVTSVSDGEDIDTVTNVEFLKFADETVSLNQAPVITLPETVTVRETLQVVIDATVTDAENDELTYIWTQVDGTDVTLIDADTTSVSLAAPAVDAQETINLQFEVSDGTNTVTKNVEVVILPNNAPVITNLTADQSVNEGDTVTLSVTATDADDDTLTYRWVVNGATVTLSGDTTDTVTFTAPNVSSDTVPTIEVFVSDSIDEVSATSTVTVKNVETSTGGGSTPEVKPAEKSSGGSFGWLMILLTAGLVLVRRK